MIGQETRKRETPRQQKSLPYRDSLKDVIVDVTNTIEFA
eukprot:CAMPEP_0116859670 /NCGR_PEP_ID=MMETSP0418-20121206/21958_1 /TAXON_ID=1158023 /ORGANISM="Astrosyne radiata, Strain 13vi08-1A" /LENGTH=38 /DNA_ID= /DNA_START= /DNA_END= /DNA_ORIENTATION=